MKKMKVILSGIVFSVVLILMASITACSGGGSASNQVVSGVRVLSKIVPALTDD